MDNRAHPTEVHQDNADTDGGFSDIPIVPPTAQESPPTDTEQLPLPDQHHQLNRRHIGIVDEIVILKTDLTTELEF